AAYAFDFGRVLPIIDVGLGGLWVVTPQGVADGQRGRTCTSNSQCDVGLVCDADNTCRVSPVLDLNAGLVVDVRVTEHLVLGAGFRYFAFLTAPADFPIYLQGSLRLGLRW